MNEDRKPPRSWRVIAEEASNEKDCNRLSDLVEELSNALQKDLTRKKAVSA